MNKWDKPKIFHHIAATTFALCVAILLTPSAALLAQDDGGQQVAQSSSSEVTIKRVQGGPMGQVQVWRHAYIDENQLLANALGLTAAELEEAYNEALEIALAQAVEDGELTQAQADDMTSDEQSRHVLRGLATQEEIDQYLAQALGLSQEDYNAAVDGAIQKAADDGLITQAQANEMLLDKLIEDTLADAYTQALNEGVAQGYITQSQADRMGESRSGICHDQNVVVVERSGTPGDSGRFHFEISPNDTFEERFHFGGSGNFAPRMQERFSDIEIFEGPSGSGE